MASILGLEVHEAASTGDYDTLEEFVKSGKYDINLGDDDWGNKTALHWSCQKGYVECIRLLLENGAKPLRTLTGWTPAHFAAENGKLSALRTLHTAGVRVDKKDNYGCTPRRLAEIYNHVECVKFLTQIEQEREELKCRAGSAYVSDDDEEEDDDVFSLPTTIAVEEKTDTSSTPPTSSRRRGQGNSRMR
ncbi:ankyrin repeat domain-containing protein 66 [Plakobranchus ocellatus]|uniref:Ankyrin repeat domain-containing protein 66 n=1 Tax=Plakobranchus ocellatus TaxID=259542 RepID=A0AAV4AFA4_9GAST|nr:ankyrin repeat domain-containing protein 66 [Plakobranchus ocellatus]